MADKDISNVGGIGPRERKMYEQEYRKSADLFQRALDQYKKSNNMYQQGEFKDVMKKAMHIMNEAARALLRKELQTETDRVSKDFATFEKFPKDPDTQTKLSNDIDQAKRSV
jgi:hypothetical protein